MAPKQQSILPEELQAAYDKWGEDFCEVHEDEINTKPAKTNYVANYVKMADGSLRKPYFKFRGMKLIKCKTPEEREQLDGIGPSYGFFENTMDNKGGNVGFLVGAYLRSWEKKVEAVKSKFPRTYQKKEVKVPMQTTYGGGKEMDNAIIRIRFRSDDKNVLRKPVSWLTSDNTWNNMAEDGSPFSESNIHTVVTGGSVGTGVVDCSSTILSQQCISNSCCNELLKIKRGTGYGLNEEDEVDQDDLDDLMGMKVEPEDDEGEAELINRLEQSVKMSPTANEGDDEDVDLDELGDD